METVSNALTSSIWPGAECSWHFAREAFGTPNVHYCEALRCGWIEQPATTWSNLAYLGVGYLILRQSRKDSEPRQMRWLGLSAIASGIGSFAFHASNNGLSQTLDFAAIFFFISLMITFNLRRVGRIKRVGRTVIALVAFNLALLFLFRYVLHVPVQYTILLNILVFLAQEASIHWRSERHFSGLMKRHLWATVLLLGVAETFSLADLLRWYCEPERSFLHGHAIWHCLSALGYYFAYLHIRRF